jgi:hypothetical protein
MERTARVRRYLEVVAKLFKAEGVIFCSTHELTQFLVNNY